MCTIGPVYSSVQIITRSRISILQSRINALSVGVVRGLLSAALHRWTYETAATPALAANRWPAVCNKKKIPRSQCVCRYLKAMKIACITYMQLLRNFLQNTCFSSTRFLTSFQNNVAGQQRYFSVTTEPIHMKLATMGEKGGNRKTKKDRSVKT